MTKQTLQHFVLSLAALGVALIPSLSVAQVGLASKLPGKGAASSRARAVRRHAQAPGSPSYTFTLLSYPGTLGTFAQRINKGATTSKVEIVGGYYGTETSSSFLVRVSGTKTVTETYQTVNYPHATESWATGVNDLGQIVGSYYEGTSGVSHGYERSSGKFTEINVPFAGALGTFPLSIDNAGEIVGVYEAADGEDYGFTLIGGTYTSINYPGATYTEVDDDNDNGDLVGLYTDTGGVYHGFLLSGGTYTSIDFPCATLTYALGINDSGDIVGVYCPTIECVSTYEGEQGFLLSSGTFTTIAIPNEFYTDVTDINNDGVVIGYYQDAAGLVVGFMATP